MISDHTEAAILKTVRMRVTNFNLINNVSLLLSAFLCLGIIACFEHHYHSFSQSIFHFPCDTHITVFLGILSKDLHDMIYQVRSVMTICACKLFDLWCNPYSITLYPSLNTLVLSKETSLPSLKCHYSIPKHIIMWA